MKDKNYKIVSLYSFFPFQENLILELKDKLLNIENKNDLSGLLIFASEGINGTICADEDVIEIVFNLLKTYTNTKKLNIKVSFSRKKVFKKLKIKIKKEIVTMGIPEINPSQDNGTYIDSANWNKLVENQNTIIIDTRNHYEFSIGTFQNSINPNTRNFSEFPKWVDDHLDSHLENKESTNIAMFCTGGIRCEKATSLLKKKGYKNIYHLQGGILQYLDDIPEEKNLFEGECYVFDKRVALNLVIGICVFHVVLDEAQINFFVVNKKYREKGFGSYLMSYLIRKCEKLNINKLFLEVSQTNVEAQKFYSRFDFCTVGIRRNYYKDGSDALLKEKKINNQIIQKFNCADNQNA